MIICQRKGIRFLLLTLGGVLTGLTLVFPSIGFLEWLTLIPAGLFLLEYATRSEVRLRTLYGYGLFFFYCYYLVVYHWFVNLYPLDFIDGMTKGAAVCVVLVSWWGLALLQALMGGVVFVLMGTFFRTSLARRVPLLRPFLAAGIWSVFEWSQTLGWWGVPWGRLPLGQSSYLLGLQTASWFGSYFVTFLLVAVNLCLAQGVIIVLRRYEIPLRHSLKPIGIAVAAMLVFQYGAGAVIWLTNRDEGEPLRVAAIQGNISSNEKWSFSSAKRTQEVYREHTLRAAEQGAELVVWPETALPYELEEGNSSWVYVSSLAKEADVMILVGAFDPSENEKEGEYNAVFCFLPDGNCLDTVYAKRKLVPFGEFVPLRGLIETLIPPLAELVMSGDDVLWGEGANLFETEKGTIGSLICFDSIYEDLTRESVLEGAELICLSTNDSWFTDSAALYMHNAQAQLRAIESGRYVVRCANTGISTIISDRGEVLSSLEPLVDGMVVEDVYRSDHRTLYTLIGNLFVFLWIAILLLLAALEIILWIRKKKWVKNMTVV
ncbi:MAG: apolipoprotein N-acyltransferase [Clostridia bacterium]|nr:apolipoprotein N-acyltransferase [Clostridia bacterium]